MKTSLRLSFLIGSVACAFVLIAYNLYTLQIEKGDHYFNRAQAQRLTDGRFIPDRGSIYFTDKNGSAIPAAITKEYPVIYAVPTEVADPVEAATRIAALIPIDSESLKAALAKPADQYELIKAKATAEEAAAVQEAQIPGVYITRQAFRYYPFGSLASHVLGYVGTDTEGVPEGKYGLESYFDSKLRGVVGYVNNEKDEILPERGGDVYTTIDQNIQGRAEEVLAQLIRDYSPKGGSIIVQETKTGKILAMASAPSFDPNVYGEAPLESFVNPVVAHTYEPGSIAKVITMAAGIDSGAITPNTTYVDTGSVTLNGYTVRNWDLKAHGTINMTQVIEESVNTGSIFAQRKTGRDAFYQYLNRFGFKSPTGIDLPNEVTGKLTPLEEYPRDINYAVASYGHGMTTTPLRLITAISAIGNKGMMRTPYITTTGENMNEERVISERSAQQVTEMMVSAVKKAKVAAIPHYKIAGKTGTAFVPEKGGYSERVINTYVGFAPADDARVTILVKINEPEGSPLAGQTVVPAFRQMMEFTLNYLNIPPDNVGSN